MSIYHKHHIIPRYMGGSDEPSNIIIVTVEQHAALHKQLWEDLGFIEDYYAWKGLSGQINLDEIKKLCAILGAEKGRKSYSLRFKTDENFRKQQIEHLKKIGPIGRQKYKEKYPNGYRFKQSKQAIQNQKEALAKIGHQQGAKNSQYGTCWITNGNEDRKIKKEELDIWLEKGYTKGRKINCNQHQKSAWA